MLCLEGVPCLPGAPQDEAGLTRKFETSHVGGATGLPQRRVVWMWFGAFPGAIGLGRAQPQRRGTSPGAESSGQVLCAQAWKPSSQHAGEKRGVAGLLLGRTERAARAAELQLCAQAR